MKRKRAKRKVVSLDTEFILGDKSYKGLIDNVSEGGLRIKTIPMKTAPCSIPGTTLELKFQHPSGKKLNLHCEAIWVHINRNLPQCLITTMGIKIIDPPEEYKTFIKSLY